VNNIPVNAPKCPMNNYQRDGAFAGSFAVSGGCPVNGANYYPNDQAEEGAPVPESQLMAPPMPVLEDAWIGHHDQGDEDYYSQAGDLFRLMSEDQKQQLVGNIAGGLSQATESVQGRMLEQFTKADPDYGKRIKAALN